MRIVRGAAAAVLLATLGSISTAAGQGVAVSFSPSLSQVAPGAVFTVDIAVTTTGSSFNGFDAVIGYDPAALTLIPMSPLSLQEGSLMTSACGTTFHVFRQGAATDTITDVILCNGAALTGPGQIYRLTFRASASPQVTVIRFMGEPRFYDAGLSVAPVHATDGVVGIGMSPLGVEPSSPPARMELRVAPNPARGPVEFTVWSDFSGPQRITVVDPSGRLVRRFESVFEHAGTRAIAWNGCDGNGRAVPAGVYYAKFDAGGRTAAGRVSILR